VSSSSISTINTSRSTSGSSNSSSSSDSDSTGGHGSSSDSSGVNEGKSRVSAESIDMEIVETFHGAIGKVEIARPSMIESAAGSCRDLGPVARKTSYLVFPHATAAYFQTLREINFMHCFTANKHCVPLLSKPYFALGQDVVSGLGEKLHKVQAQPVLSVVHHMPAWPMTLTDFVDGTSNGQRVGAFRHFLAQFCHALSPLHANGMAHGDLKPHNVMFDPCNGQNLIGLIDFNSMWFENRPGIRQICTATFRAPELFWHENVTRDTEARFLNPQQDFGRVFGPWNDVWSLGLIMLFLVTGDAPLEGFLNQEVPSDDPDAGGFITPEEQLRIARYVCRRGKPFSVSKYLRLAGIRRGVDIEAADDKLTSYSSEASKTALAQSLVDSDGDVEMTADNNSSNASRKESKSSTPKDTALDLIWLDAKNFDEIESLLQRMLEQDVSRRITIPEIMTAICEDKDNKQKALADSRQETKAAVGGPDVYASVRAIAHGKELLGWSRYDRTALYRASEDALSQAISKEWSGKERSRRSQFLARYCRRCIDTSWNFKSMSKSTLELSISLMDRYWVQARKTAGGSKNGVGADVFDGTRVYSTSRIGSAATTVWSACALLAEFTLVDSSTPREAALLASPIVRDIVDVVECLDFDLYRPSLLSVCNGPVPCASSASSWSRDHYECHNLHAAASLAVRPEFVHWSLEEKRRQFVAFRLQQLPTMNSSRRIHILNNLQRQVKHLDDCDTVQQSTRILKSALEYAHDLSLFGSDSDHFREWSKSFHKRCVTAIEANCAAVEQAQKEAAVGSEQAAKLLESTKAVLGALQVAKDVIWR
jgi:serine/threonine protein kinase